MGHRFLLELKNWSKLAEELKNVKILKKIDKYSSLKYKSAVTVEYELIFSRWRFLR